MNNQLSNNLTMNETDVIASRRNFLARLAYGSLLVMGSSGIAEAAVKHASTKKASTTKHTDKSAKSAKHSSHEKVASKAEHDRHHDKKADSRHHIEHAHSKHDEHKKLASNSHRVHESLHKDRDGGHRLSVARERVALHDDETRHRIHHTLRKDFNPKDMPEFAFEEHEFDADHLSDSDLSSRFSLSTPRNNRVITPKRGGIAHKTLALHNTTTGDSLNVTYFERGRYLPDALHEINFLYRDHLNDEVHPIDVALLDQLHDLQDTLGVKKQIQVICGYRSPSTNAHLRRHSRGVAKRSLHMEGRAIDIRIPGVGSGNIRDAALSMARGGVGYYPGSNFVHLDTGSFRTW